MRCERHPDVELEYDDYAQGTFFCIACETECQAFESRKDAQDIERSEEADASFVGPVYQCDPDQVPF